MKAFGARLAGLVLAVGPLTAVMFGAGVPIATIIGLFVVSGLVAALMIMGITMLMHGSWPWE